jgi:hypothetical protein
VEVEVEEVDGEVGVEVLEILEEQETGTEEDNIEEMNLMSASLWV